MADPDENQGTQAGGLGPHQPRQPRVPPAPEVNAPSALRVWSLEERKSALAQSIASNVAQGYRVESQSDYQAILVKGSKPNHTLHVILTLLTLGFWLLVYIPVLIFQKERRSIVKVDEYGNTLIQPV